MDDPNRTMILCMMVLMIWTTVVLLLLAVKRVGGTSAGRLDPKYYTLFRGGQEPDDVAVVARHFHNLLEMPPLFYAVVLAVIAAGKGDATYAWLAVAYTTARLLHAGVHLTVNVVPARFGLFFVSVMLQTAMAVRLALQML